MLHPRQRALRRTFHVLPSITPPWAPVSFLFIISVDSGPGFHLLATGLGPEGAARFLAGSMATSIRESFQRHWESFVCFRVKYLESLLHSSH